MTPAASGFTRLDVDERRRSLLECGRKLFTQEPYDELSMAMIAREAGISKALLYHYFPSKQAFFMATMQDAAAELAERVRPDASAPPGEQLDQALGTWLDWIEDNRDAFGRLLQAANGVAEVRGIVDQVRSATADLIMERLAGDGDRPPTLRLAVCSWLWMMDGACLQWVRDDAVDRDQVQAMARAALPALLDASGHPDLAGRLA